MLTFFTAASKSTDVSFDGQGNVKVSKDSPIGALKNEYRIHVRHTLNWTLLTRTKFLIASQTLEQPMLRTLDVVYTISPKNPRGTARLDFGKAVVASKDLIGESQLKDDPVMSTEILRIEPL